MAPFFAEQLTAFEIWLEYASQKARNELDVKSPPSSMGGTPMSSFPEMSGRQQCISRTKSPTTVADCTARAPVASSPCKSVDPFETISRPGQFSC
jgi:hypothetical protein|mmetsp:Transcript_30796/g.62021  ORF Transcript_30796/g.62021 Transcript_30796/m.62021 type:complete len:95 (-) Transcript_30796:4672-4956(-)